MKPPATATTFAQDAPEGHARTREPRDIRLRSGLPRWRNKLYCNAVVLALACLAVWSVWGAWQSWLANQP